MRFVPPENWHITLRFEADSTTSPPHSTPPPSKPAMVGLGPAVDVLAGQPADRARIGPGPPHPSVTACTRTIGERPRPRFVGHLTLARLSAKGAIPRRDRGPFDARFDVDEVALVESRLHPDGARYETLHTWAVPPGGSG